MLKLDDDEARVLVRRIAKAIRKARYHPAAMKDEEAAAREVIGPYVSARFKDQYSGVETAG